MNKLLEVGLTFKKKIDNTSIWDSLRWFFGVMFLLLSIQYLFTNFTVSIIALLLTLFMLPPITNKVQFLKKLWTKQPSPLDIVSNIEAVYISLWVAMILNALDAVTWLMTQDPHNTPEGIYLLKQFLLTLALSIIYIWWKETKNPKKIESVSK